MLCVTSCRIYKEKSNNRLDAQNVLLRKLTLFSLLQQNLYHLKNEISLKIMFELERLK